ncbi:MAG TPA: Xaa-Pro peptidase family protein [Blastocatellia bacterium]|nr:Xaa-Pro peptidase family protein [Blastocatellia bacterium]
MRIAEIQKSLREQNLDGWLFYSFRGSDPLALRILQLQKPGIATRRWFYFIPAEGEPTKIVHSIERDKLDELPGKKIVYLLWNNLHESIRETIAGHKRIAMQYSPNNAIPYISRVDAGTIELIKSFGAEIVSSGDLVAQFESVWSPEQFEMNKYSTIKMREILDETFAEIARRIRNDGKTDEYAIQSFMVGLYERDGLDCDNDPPIVAVNANAANPHYQPNKDRFSPMNKGDFVLIDMWAKKKEPKSTYTDITWTGFIGESVPDKYTKIFNVVRDGRDAAIKFVQDNIRAGNTIYGWQVDDAARNSITKAGYGDKFIHRTGHSIGEEVHGNGAHMDNIETHDERRIIPNTSFSIEPGVYLEGDFGVRSEIDMYVTESDAFVLGPPPQTEVVAILKQF